MNASRRPKELISPLAEKRVRKIADRKGEELAEAHSRKRGVLLCTLKGE